ncbi:MAG: lysophospholipase [Pirellulales bacterium]
MSSEPSWIGESISLSQLQTIVVRPQSRIPTHMIVLCHGYGAPGDDLAQLAGEFVELADSLQIAPAMFFPAAPIDLGEYGMPGARAWWPLNMARLMELSMTRSFDRMRNETPPEIDRAREALVGMIAAGRTQYGLEETTLLLGGFSQGAMLSVDVALRGLPQPPQAMALYSGALICEEVWKAKSSGLSQTKIFQSHGRQDAILPFETGSWLAELLKAHAAQFEFHAFDGPHTIPYEAISSTLNLLV